MSVILEIKEATKTFGGLKANENISFEVEKGTIVGVVGPNGAGKTTLFNSISRTHNLSSGKIIFKGKDITKLHSYEACWEGMGRTYQIPQALEDMSVIDNILVGALYKRKKVHEAREFSKEIAEFCGLTELKDKLASGLNVMQKKRLEIARALAGEPELLLLDETMAGLNGVEREEAIELIRKINRKGITILMIEHVMQVVMSVSDKVVVIVSGKKLMEGTPAEVTSDEQVINAYLGGGHNTEC